MPQLITLVNIGNNNVGSTYVKEDNEGDNISLDEELYNIDVDFTI